MFQNLKNLYHIFQSIIANLYYRFPSSKLRVIGVTGTDGKTTTSHLIYHILKTAGKKVSLISSVYANIGGVIYDTGFHVTTPDVFPLLHFLKKGVSSGDEYFVLETTSHALAQNRVWGIDYFAGVLTNVTHEHLDFHKTYLNYLQAKAKLLKRAKLALINADDASFKLLKKDLRKYYTYGLKNSADFKLDISKKLGINLPKFNSYNFLAAYSICRLLAVPEKIILAAIKTFKLPPGRLEIIQQRPFTVIIDFAHTPNAIAQVLSTIKSRYLTGKNRLIHVFGSAGKRDASKRPLMGKTSGSYCNLAILTEEDYRNEDPVRICRQIATGLEKKRFRLADPNSSKLDDKTYLIIPNRQKAIEKAVALAEENDVIVFTGKSHEKSLCRGNQEYPWNEKEAVISAIKYKLKQK